MKKFLHLLLVSTFMLCFVIVSHAQTISSTDENELLQRLKNEEVNFDGLIPSSSYEATEVDQKGNLRVIKKTNTGRAGELGRRIESGTIRLKDLPIFIVKAIDLFSKIAGSVAVLMLMYGGIQYMFGELLGTNDQAKQTIKYAIGGLILTFFAWLAINLVKTQLTGVDYFGQVQERNIQP